MSAPQSSPLSDTLIRALGRVGASVARGTLNEKQATIFIRINLEMSEKWVTTITEILLGSQGTAWRIDLSKFFYVERGMVKYLWRLVVTQDVGRGIAFVERCAITASSQAVKELTEFPLVGRATYRIDVARGKTKGAHGKVTEGVDLASNVLVAHFIPG